MKTKGRPVAIYARYSSDLQKCTSIDDQIVECRRYAERNGMKVVATFSDDAKTSATLFDRDGALDLLQAARRGEFTAVIVETFNRLSRDQEDSNGLFKRLTFHGVEIHTLGEGAVDQIRVGLHGIAGAMFMDNLKRNVRRGHGRVLREGRIPGSLPYGYKPVPGRKGEWEIDEAKAAIVRRIFVEYAGGTSPRSIAAGLNRDRIPGPTGRAPWSHQTFTTGRYVEGKRAGMISNPLYVGRLMWNATRSALDPDTGKAVKRTAPVEDLVTVEVPHLAILDPDLFERANAVRRDRSDKLGVGKRVIRKAHVPRRGDYLLNGLLRCGACGGHMRIYKRDQFGQSFVACTEAQRYDRCDNRKGYAIHRLEKLVREQMRERLTNPEVIRAFTAEYIAEYAADAREARAERADGTRKLNRITVQIDRLVDALANGADLPAVTAKLQALEAERVGLAERLRTLEADGNVVEFPTDLADHCKQVARLCDELEADVVSAEARMAFHNYMHSVVVHVTPKRARYEVTPYTRREVLMNGLKLFPSKRRPATIIAAHGYDDNVKRQNSPLTLSTYEEKLVSLGRWLERAAA